jgi:hypothetical protein
LFDVLKAGPLARLGYHQYTYINNIFDMQMPFMPDDQVSMGVLGGDLENIKKRQEEAEKAVEK